ncbi:golgin candidate 5 [Silene latifolia]|uniref:golgin candidate 5 n=1 Tax=Silene latifolia TaxID=37657 RepID=UPI003D77BC46
MDWFGARVSNLGNLDLAGAVNKLQESVKNIEKNFDNALGLEDSSQSSIDASGQRTSTSRNALFDPVMAFMGQKEEESEDESKANERPQDDELSKTNDDLPVKSETTEGPSSVDGQKDDVVDDDGNPATEKLLPLEVDKDLKEQKDHVDSETVEEASSATKDSGEAKSDAQEPDDSPESTSQDAVTMESSEESYIKEQADMRSSEEHESYETTVQANHTDEEHSHNGITREVSNEFDMQEAMQESTVGSTLTVEGPSDDKTGNQIEDSETSDVTAVVVESGIPTESQNHTLLTELSNVHGNEIVSNEVSQENDEKIEEPKPSGKDVAHGKDDRLSPTFDASDSAHAVLELDKVRKEMKMMEAALQGAARQAQTKADEIARLMHENEQMKSIVEELRRKSNDAEVESLREEYHQRVATLERKVYALTKERDTLRREQNKRTDAAALLKEKDEIITQVMAEGEELSKKQAAQEAQIRKLRAQVREMDEEKKSLIAKLQLEENKIENIMKDKAATEKVLQDTIEKHQAELATQKEYFTNALNAAKEAESLAEARANNEARAELEGRLREAEEREGMLVQALEELRQTLTRQEQQGIVKEDMLRRDIEDLQKRYQESERRCEELVSQLPESTRPLLRQIEAMQETSARKAEAWATVERTLQSRLQEAEAKAAAAEERERSINERLSQTLSRINVLEAQISCLRTEQTQLNKSLEKERQRAAENRQEYLAAKEVADTHEGRVRQLEEEIKELKRKHKSELQESLAHRELLQQDLEREKAAKSDLEKAASAQSASLAEQSPTSKNKSAFENGMLTRKLSTASSVGNMEESFFLQASLGSSSTFLERRNSGEATMSPYYLKSMTPSTFEATLRQKEGELASYMSRLASLESIRDSLAEELVKMTEQCEKLRTEAAMLPGIRAELEALRRRHTAALELMGERDEELEELRADIVDLKEMYREQVNLLVNQIQGLGSRTTAA